MYSEGTIKLTWINPSDYTILESSMYDSVNTALKNIGDKKDWMIFQLQKVEGDSYKWKLLPYGKYKSFVNGMRFRNSGLYGITIFSIACLSFYGIYKLISK